ncbi:MAG: hypothetical protein V4494_05950 [Chlamydiota bacterium]
MSSDWYRMDQFSRTIDENFFYPFYEKLSSVAENHPNIAYSAPLIGGIDGLANLVQGTGAVAESGIKGVSNVFWGISTCDKTSLKVGALQVGLGAGLIGVLLIPQVAFRTLRITACMAIDPKETSRQEREKYHKLISQQVSE